MAQVFEFVQEKIKEIKSGQDDLRGGMDDMRADIKELVMAVKVMAEAQRKLSDEIMPNIWKLVFLLVAAVIGIKLYDNYLEMTYRNYPKASIIENAHADTQMPKD